MRLSHIHEVLGDIKKWEEQPKQEQPELEQPEKFKKPHDYDVASSMHQWVENKSRFGAELDRALSHIHPLTEQVERHTLAEILNNLMAWPVIEEPEEAEISGNPLDNITDEFESDEDRYAQVGKNHGAKVIDLYPTAVGDQFHPGQTFDDNEEAWSLPPGIILGRVELVAGRAGVEEWGPTVQMGNEYAAMVEIGSGVDWVHIGRGDAPATSGPGTPDIGRGTESDPWVYLNPYRDENDPMRWG